MKIEELILIKGALLKLRAEGPQCLTVGICGNLRAILSLGYFGGNVYSWVMHQAAEWPELDGRSFCFPIGDWRTVSWDPKSEFGARRLRFLDYLIERVDMQGDDDE